MAKAINGSDRASRAQVFTHVYQVTSFMSTTSTVTPFSDLCMLIGSPKVRQEFHPVSQGSR